MSGVSLQRQITLDTFKFFALFNIILDNYVIKVFCFNKKVFKSFVNTFHDFFTRINKIYSLKLINGIFEEWIFLKFCTFEYCVVFRWFFERSIYFLTFKKFLELYFPKTSNICDFFILYSSQCPKLSYKISFPQIKHIYKIIYKFRCNKVQ